MLHILPSRSRFVGSSPTSPIKRVEVKRISELITSFAISDHRKDQDISNHPYSRRIRNRTRFIKELSVPPENIQPGDIVCYFPRKCPKGIPLVVYAQVKPVSSAVLQ